MAGNLLALMELNRLSVAQTSAAEENAQYAD
jgi:hypothetical protein